MAEDQSGIAVELARLSAINAGKFMNALDDLQEIYNWANNAGINFTTFATQIEGQDETKHIPTGKLNHLLLTAVNDVMTYLSSTSTGGSTYRQLFELVRNV